MAQIVFFGLIGMAATILTVVLNVPQTAVEIDLKPRPLGTVSWNG